MPNFGTASGHCEAAKKAVDMIKYRDGRFLDTLAAAYAEAGEFDKAVETQQKAIDDPEFMKDEGAAGRPRPRSFMNSGSSIAFCSASTALSNSPASA